MSKLEFEIKALVPNLEELKEKVKNLYDMSRCKLTHSKQLNHYFKVEHSSLESILDRFIKDLDKKEKIINSPKVAIRTRWDSEEGVFLIFKYSIVDNNAENGTERIEEEIEIKMSLEDLDKELLSVGASYQSMWSRSRTKYIFDSGWGIYLDENAGFGPICEVEYVTTKEDFEKNRLYYEYKAQKLLKDMGLKELPSDLLQDMFEFYSQHYPEYYKTDKVIWSDYRFKHNNLPINLSDVSKAA